MIPTYRVSHLAAYARYRVNDEYYVGKLFTDIFQSEETESMKRGTAFHKCLEKAVEGEYDIVSSDGYTFAFTCNAEITLPRTREQRRSKDYGGIIVTGQCDGIEGKRIIDHKTVQQFDAEYHLDGWQHRFYMDIFGADRFDWHIWECSELKDHEAERDPFTTVENSTQFYDVYAHHLLTQYRYPNLEKDCRQLALEFAEFAQRMGWEGRAA